MAEDDGAAAGQAGPPRPGEPGVVVLERPLSEQEQLQRVRAGIRGSYQPRIWWALALALVALMAITWLTVSGDGWQRALWAVVIVAAAFAALVAGLIAVGVRANRRSLLKTYEAELGPGRTLSIAWNAWGLSVGGGEVTRSLAYSDVWLASVRSAGEGQEFLCLRSQAPIVGLTLPVMALPLDLVPDSSLQALRGRGLVKA